MSDLQCAARLFVARATDDGASAARLADSVASERIARVWTSPTAHAVQTAQAAAARLGVEVVVRQELASDGSTEGEVGAVVMRVRGVLEEVADLHRGEAVLVVSHGAVLDRVLPRLAANLRSDHASVAPLSPGGFVQLDGDADGWVARSWDGNPLP